MPIVIVPASFIFCSVGPRPWADAVDGPNARHAAARDTVTRLLLASFDMIYYPSSKIRLLDDAFGADLT